VNRRLLLALLTLLPTSSGAGSDAGLDQGYNDMYNLAFTDAHRCFQGWERSHRDDPMGPVSDAAAYLFSEFNRLHILESEFFANDSAFFHRRTGAPDPAVKVEFDRALQQTQQLADPILQRSADDERALFATVLRFGLEADYMALIEKRYLASLDEVKQGRSKAEQLLERGATLIGAPDLQRHVVHHRSTGEGLIRLATSENADVVVFGSDYRTATGHVIPQKSAERLMTGGPVAVAIAPAGFRSRSSVRIVRIGVLSDGDDAAGETARGLGTVLDASVVEFDDEPVDLLVLGSRCIVRGRAAPALSPAPRWEEHEHEQHEGDGERND